MGEVATEREIFARNLRNVVAQSHMNQSQIAEKLGVSRGTMNDYLNARAYPRPEKLAILCKILGVTQQELTTQNGAQLPEKEILALANIFEDPEKKEFFLAIQKLSEEEFKSVKAVVMSIAGGR